MKKNNEQKYSLISEKTGKIVGTAMIHQKSIYLATEISLENAFIQLINRIIDKAGWNNITWKKNEEYIQVDYEDELFFKALMQDSARFIQIHFVIEGKY